MAPTTARKATPAKSTPASQPFDFSAVQAESAPAPVRKGGVAAKDNPAAPWVKASWDGRGEPNASGTVYGAGRVITVPSHENAKQAQALIRSAASAYGKSIGQDLGVAFAVEDTADGKVSVRFAVKTAKKILNRRRKSTAPAESAPAAPTT